MPFNLNLQSDRSIILIIDVCAFFLKIFTVYSTYFLQKFWKSPKKNFERSWLNFFSKLLLVKQLKSGALIGQKQVKHEREPKEQGIPILDILPWWGQEKVYLLLTPNWSESK
jgi:hypothetical protein